MSAPRWRAFPPVYSPLPWRAVFQAWRAHGDPHAALVSAEVALQALTSHRVVRTLGSGTSALQVALGLAASVRRGTAVALPAYCCPDVATAAIANRLRIRLYDVDPRTLQPSWESVGRVLGQGAGVLVITHLYGRMQDVPQAIELAAHHGALVVEDAAQGACASWNGAPAGTLASLGILSFGRGKGTNAGGGGALLLDPAVWPDVPSQLAPVSGRNSLVAWGKAAVAHALSAPRLYAIPSALPFLGIGETAYHAPVSSHGPTVTALALLPHVLRAQPALAAQRREVEAWYRAALHAQGDLLFDDVPAPCVPGALRLPVRLTPAEAAPLASFGVARSYPRTLAEYPEITPWLDGAEPLPGARALAGCVHTLPTHALLSRHDREALVQALVQALRACTSP